MREAIITIVCPSEDERPEAYTKVFRVEFEGEFGIVGEVAENTDTFELRKVVSSEQLSAATEPHLQVKTLPRH